jgi:hypothetical protein
VAARLGEDCNTNGVPDECDLASGTGNDRDGDGQLDECETLSDVGASVSVTFSGLRFDRATGESWTIATITNTSTEVVEGPVRLVVNSVTPASILLASPDGNMPGGEPYVDFSSMLIDSVLPPGHASSERVAFLNPNRLRFQANLSVFGVVPSPPPCTAPMFFLGNMLKGDLNCDGVVDFADVDPFVQALVDPAAYATAYPNCLAFNADCNGDGKLDFADISALVSILSGG